MNVGLWPGAGPGHGGFERCPRKYPCCALDLLPAMAVGSQMSARPIPSEAVLIVNAHSRKGEELFVEAKEKLERAGVRLIAAHAIRDPAMLNDAVRAAVREGAPMVIVGGGDGSLSSTID